MANMHVWCDVQQTITEERLEGHWARRRVRLLGVRLSWDGRGDKVGQVMRCRMRGDERLTAQRLRLQCESLKAVSLLLPGYMDLVVLGAYSPGTYPNEFSSAIYPLSKHQLSHSYPIQVHLPEILPKTFLTSCDAHQSQ